MRFFKPELKHTYVSYIISKPPSEIFGEIRATAFSTSLGWPSALSMRAEKKQQKALMLLKSILTI